jgi:hypothetical protein
MGGYWTSAALSGDQMLISHTGFPDSSINKPTLELATGDVNKGTWAFDRIDDSINAGWFTSLAVGPNGLPAVTQTKTSYPQGELFLMTKAADGKWDSTQIDYDVIKHSLAVDAQGFYHVAYNRMSEEFLGKRELWYGTNAPDGKWHLTLVDGRQYSEASTGHYPHLKIDAKGGKHIVYEDSYHLRVMYARLLPAADGQEAKWEVTQVTRSKQDGYYANMDIDDQGALHVAYDDGSELYYATCSDCAVY